MDEELEGYMMLELMLILCLFDAKPRQAPELRQPVVSMPPQAPEEPTHIHHVDNVVKPPMMLKPVGEGWHYESNGGYWWRYMPQKVSPVLLREAEEYINRHSVPYERSVTPMSIRPFSQGVTTVRGSGGC